MAQVAALQKKLVSLRNQIANIEKQLEAANKFGNIEVGGTVGFSFGRGENKKNEQGKVLGLGVLPNGVAVVAVQVGTGIDVTVKRVPQSTVNAYVPPVTTADAPATATDAVLAGEASTDDALEINEAVATDGTINADALLASA